MRRPRDVGRWLALLALCALVPACGTGDDGDRNAPASGGALGPPAAPAPPSHADRIRTAALAIDDARLAEAANEPGNWLTTGRDPAEQRFSPLTRIHANNVAGLRLAWRFPTGLRQGHEATPLVVDGVMYVTGSWSVVFALDAGTGRLLWKWDPHVNREVGRKTCCDAVNRGVALYRGRVYVGVLDGRLAALDAGTGELVWETWTVDPALDYTVTGAPRVVDGKLILGNGGAEFGVRGYVSAYDPDTGEVIWRTYTVPGDPSRPFESEALARAAETWNGEWWKVGGGGTVWDSMAYDPELRLLYVGTGNGSPWTRYDRSPGGGDNLFLSSILALDPDTGELRWHYQTTPGDNWDFTATQHMVLADLRIDGRTRKVLMQAPKNGFFYVLDRETGELLRADPYVTVSWASHVDMQTGRPVETASGDYEGGIAIVQPTFYGGHNWQPMSFNPITGLVYIPAQEIAGAYKHDLEFVYRPGRTNLGLDSATFTLMNRELVSGHLLAWDPVAGREVWRHPHGIAWNGGTLTTAGNLVFQGTADGRFLALRADDGKLLWQSHSARSGVIAAPITYEVDGVQYVTVVAGWGGAFAVTGGDAAAAARVDSVGEVITWALIGGAVTPEQVAAALDARDPQTKRGSDLYHNFCFQCHGANAIAGGVHPDLRQSIGRLGDAFAPIVRGGLPGTSMPGFGDLLDDEDIAAVRGYLERVAH